MRLIIDAMSGDKAPHEIIAGGILGAEAYGVEIVFCGDEKTVKDILDAQYPKTGAKIDIIPAETVLTMEDDPLSVIKSKKNSSMGVGLSALKEGAGDALLSAGNTGALLTGASLLLRRIRGIHRAAIGSVLPSAKPTLLIDSGANVEVSPEDLLSFALMGSIYMKRMYSLESPGVGLLNNGTESCKGTRVHVEAYKLLEACKDIRFVGNIEGGMMPYGYCDVLVADGFSGNICLKTLEGVGKYVMSSIKASLLSTFRSKIGALLAKKQFKQLARKFSADEYGGAPLLGVSKPVIKAHGSSGAVAVKHAVKQAKVFYETGVIDEILSLAAVSKN